MRTLIWGVLPPHIVSDEVAVDRFSQSADESVDDEEEFWQSFFVDVPVEKVCCCCCSDWGYEV